MKNILRLTYNWEDLKMVEIRGNYLYVKFSEETQIVDFDIYKILFDVNEYLIKHSDTSLSLIMDKGLDEAKKSLEMIDNLLPNRLTIK